MTLTNETNECLERIREKIQGKDHKWSGNELNDLAVVYTEIVETATSKKDVRLDKSCHDCIMQAVGVAYNYITFHETKPVEAQTPGKMISLDEQKKTKFEILDQETFNVRSKILEELEFVPDALNAVFIKTERVNDLVFTSTLQMQRVHEMSDDEFERMLIQIRPETKQEMEPVTLEVYKSRNETVTSLGFILDPCSGIFSNSELASITNDQLNYLSDQKFEELIAPFNIEQTKKTPEKDENDAVQLKYDIEKKHIVIVEEGKDDVPFNEDLDVLKYDVLFELGKQKGWKGARPPKAKLIEFINEK